MYTNGDRQPLCVQRGSSCLPDLHYLSCGSCRFLVLVRNCRETLPGITRGRCGALCTPAGDTFWNGAAGRLQIRHAVRAKRAENLQRGLLRCQTPLPRQTQDAMHGYEPRRLVRRACWNTGTGAGKRRKRSLAARSRTSGKLLEVLIHRKCPVRVRVVVAAFL